MHRRPTEDATASAVLHMCLMMMAVGGLLLPLVGCTPPQAEERVVAFVNGKPITQTELDHEWADLPEATKARYEKEGGRQVFLKELVDHEMLLQEARRQGLDLDDAIRDRVRRYKEKLLIDELLKDRMKTTVELTKEELDRYYEQHASELLTPLKVRVAQMLLPNYPAAKDLETQVNRGAISASLPSATRSITRRKPKAGTLGRIARGWSSPKWMTPSGRSNPA